MLLLKGEGALPKGKGTLEPDEFRDTVATPELPPESLTRRREFSLQQSIYGGSTGSLFGNVS